MKPISGVIIFFFIPFSMFGQTIQNKADTTNTKRIIVYESYQGYKKEGSVLRNCIVINPLGILVGDYPLFYERNVKGKFHVLLGAGVTYTNYIYNLTGMNSDFFSNTTFFDDGLKRESRLGYTLTIQPKIYVNDVDFEGLYFGLQYRYRNYNYVSDSYYDEPISMIKEYRNISDILFNIGYSYNLGSDIIFDYYVGFGVRTTQYQYAAVTPIYNMNTTYQTDLHKEKKGSPTGTIGFRLGYAF